MKFKKLVYDKKNLIDNKSTYINKHARAEVHTRLVKDKSCVTCNVSTKAVEMNMATFTCIKQRQNKYLPEIQIIKPT